MNIFFTSFCPKECARYLDDKRVVKMCLETAQMLSTAVRSTGIDLGYKSSHLNHPSNIWVRKSQQNFQWLVAHGLELCKEYTRRYCKIHSSEKVIMEMAIYADRLPSIGMTALPNCAANKDHKLDFKSEPCIYTAYRKYLAARFTTDKKPPMCKLGA